MIAGGASFAPSRWSFAAEAMEARSRSACESTARIDGAQEHQELQVGVRLVLRVEEVGAGIGRHRPVDVLARAVHAGERLLVQRRLQAVARGDALERLHQHHLMIARDMARLEERRDLVLARRHFVVPRLHRHAEPVELLLRLGHERQHPRRDGAEVVVLELLALRRLGAEERPLAGEQVGTAVVEVAVDEEVLLLRPDGRVDPPHAVVGAEEPEDPHRLLGERLDRAEQRDLGVERLAGPGDERGRDAERDVVVAPDEERRAGGVPGRVAARLERGAEAARGEARRVRLALDQVGAGEVEDHAARAVRRRQRVVLFGGEAGERLEPVGVVGRAVLDGPVLHRRGDDVGDLRVERLAVIDRPEQAPVDVLRQTLPHDAPREDVGAENAVDTLGGGAAIPAIGESAGRRRDGGGHRALHLRTNDGYRVGRGRHQNNAAAPVRLRRGDSAYRPSP